MINTQFFFNYCAINSYHSTYISIAKQWMHAIKLRKYQSIKELMGHAELSPAIRRINQIGDQLFQKKLKSECEKPLDTESYVSNPMYSNPSSTIQ